MKKFLYWFASCTWGIIMTLIGALVTLVLMCCGKKPKKFGWDIYIIVGKGWGGLEFGPFFLTDSEDNYETKCHEHGHGFQNCYLGPLFPLLVGLPSAARYWLREMDTQKKKKLFSCLLLLCIVIVFGAMIDLGIVFSVIPLIIIASAIVCYGVALWVWLLFIETPKYENNKYVDYDAFWAEGDATERGTNFMKSFQQREH